jgi:outer membrane protein assembly factor BamB
MRRAVAIVCLAAALRATTAAAWLVTVQDGFATSVAMDARGDVVVGGSVRVASVAGAFDGLVIKLSATTGAEIWRRTIANGAIESLIVDASGDVVAGGDFAIGGTILKLAGASGDETWRYVLPEGAFHAVVAAADGDVAAVGALRSRRPPFPSALSVVMLDGDSGAERWRHQGPPSRDTAVAVAVDVTGDVVACGDTTPDARGPTAFTVLKLDRRSGRVLWRRSMRGAAHGEDQCDAVAIDRSRNVVAVGRTVGRDAQVAFTVAKLDGSTGHALWRRIAIGSTPRQRGRARSVVVEPSGKLIAAGSISNQGSGVDVALVKLNANGSRHWRRMIHGTVRESLRDPPYPGEGAWALAVDPTGDVVAVGAIIDTAEADMSFMVTKLARTTGRVKWLRTLGRGTSLATAVAIAPGGTIVAAGGLHTAATRDFAVVQLDGASGQLLP